MKSRKRQAVEWLAVAVGIGLFIWQPSATATVLISAGFFFMMSQAEPRLAGIIGTAIYVAAFFVAWDKRGGDLPAGGAAFCSFFVSGVAVGSFFEGSLHFPERRKPN